MTHKAREKRKTNNRHRLFPRAVSILRADNQLSRLLVEAHKRVQAGAVKPMASFDEIMAELAEFEFSKPRDLNSMLNWVISKMEHGLVHITHPRYFGLFNPAPTFPAQCADRIVARFNPQLASTATSPAAVAIEAHVIKTIAARIGLEPHAAGHFTSGGSEANFTALICALTRANSGYAHKGARAFAGAPVFYASADSHLAWIKIAHQAGIGRDAVKLIPTNGSGQISIEILAEAIQQDRAEGCEPLMIVATAGTTNAGMIDPLRKCAELAEDNALWFHVDAAWGGALIASTRLRGQLDGIERADSVTIDAHKWFATTMACGMFLSRHTPVLISAFDVANKFMPSHLSGLDPYLTSTQWSRRFLGLRLFLSLGVAGWDGYAAHVEHSISLIALFSLRMKRIGWIVSNNPSLAVACVEPPFGSATARDIVARVIQTGQAWVSLAVFEGRDVIRVCAVNGESTREDILLLVNLLEECRVG